MHRTTLRSFFAALLLAPPLVGLGASAQTIHEVADALGDGAGNALTQAYDVAMDANGDLYVVGYGSDNVLKVSAPMGCATGGTPCTVTEIMDASGDGAGNGVSNPESIAVDANGNVYVASSGSDSVHRIAAPVGCSTSGTPCTITQIIDANGDGTNALSAATGIAVDASGNVFVGGRGSSNAFQIATPGTCSTNGTPCTITQIIWFHGAPGGGNRLTATSDVAVDAAGNVYVSAGGSDNAFKVETPGTCSTGGTLCTVTEIIDDSGDGAGNALAGTARIAVDSSGLVYVTGEDSHNAFQIDPSGGCDTNGTPCTASQIIDASGDGAGSALTGATGLAIDADDNVYVSGALSDNVLRIDTPGSCSTGGTPCTISTWMDASGDGSGNALAAPTGVLMNDQAELFVAGEGSDNVFQIVATGAAPVPSFGTLGQVLLVSLVAAGGLVFLSRRPASATSE